MSGTFDAPDEPNKGDQAIEAKNPAADETRVAHRQQVVAQTEGVLLACARAE